MIDGDEGPYHVFGQVGELLAAHVLLTSQQESGLWRVLNELGEGSLDDQNIVVVACLDGRTSQLEARGARQNLRGNALKLFERVARGWTNG
ncbi:MAG: hypothetical protein ACO1OG_10400 [Devosia sp.]